MAFRAIACLSAVHFLLQAACSTAPTSPTLPPGNAIELPVAPTKCSRCIRGRLVFDGKPVGYYGVRASDSFTSVNQSPMTVVSASNGGFELRGVRSDSVDLVFAGPGFSRKVLSGVKIGAVPTELGDVVATPGFAVRGKVIDINGNAVRNAKVRVTQGVETEDPLENLARGNFASETNATGEYEILGFSIVDLTGRKATISASSRDGRVSFNSRIGAGNLLFDIEVLPSGTIEGAVRLGNTDVLLVVTPIADAKRPFHVRLQNGNYSVTVPEGEYDVRPWAMSGGVPSVVHRVRVSAGARVFSDFP